MRAEFPICYQTFGYSENPCILLINGLGGQLIHWPAVFTDNLVNAGYYVVAFDNRDIGLSKYYDEYGAPDFAAVLTSIENHQDFKPAYNLYDMAGDAIELLDHLNIKKARQFKCEAQHMVK